MNSFAVDIRADIVRREVGYNWRARFCSEMAERVGFEPTIRF